MPRGGGDDGVAIQQGKISARTTTPTRSSHGLCKVDAVHPKDEVQEALGCSRTNRRHMPRPHLSARQTYYYSVGRRRQAPFAKRASFVTCIMMMMMTIVTGPL